MRRRASRTGALATACAAVALATPACTLRVGAPPTPSATAEFPAGATVRRPNEQKIQHVVVIVQENRSFDNLFYGYPGADTATSGRNSQGQTIQLQPVSLAAQYDITHVSKDFFAACDGDPPGQNCKMDGFDKEAAGGSTPPNPQYGYVPAGESAPYFAIAHQYVLGDRMFTSHIDASFVSHQYIIAGQAARAIDLPTYIWGCHGGKSDAVLTLNDDRTYGPSESPCFNYQTIGDELERKGLSWHFYASSQSGFDWLAYQAIKHVRNGPDWKSDVSLSSAQFFTDVGNGKLATVTWITPSCRHSDHSSCGSTSGPQWVTNLVNTIGKSRFWKTTTVFVMWDEWGGWYDHVAPPYLDYDGLGFRVPLLIISPYAKQNYVSHVQFEHGSILKYIEDTFGLARLAQSDVRANSPVPDAIDYSRSPRTFTPFATQLQPRDFIAEPADRRPVDDDR